MKTIIVHIGPDLDAITAIWLVKTFFPGWIEASIGFVPAGKTLKDLPPDDNGEILHLDTGFGKFDHHQTDADICASTLVYEVIKKNSGKDPSLERIVTLVNDIDHFKEVYYPNPTADYWEFSLVGQIDGWRLLYSEDPQKIVALGMEALDAIYKIFQNKIWAEKEIKEIGKEFDTKWGKALGIETVNDEVVHLAQKMGYMVVIRKDPNKGYMRLKSRPERDIDLTEAYEKLKKQEPESTWFLHASKHMVLNGSSKNPDMKPTKKTLDQLIAV
ncbi:MAG: hypothetical protein AAB508_02785, partial [Patescibacteria group bacterium]